MISNFYALELEPGKRYTQTLERDLHISQAALDAKASDNGRVVLQCEIDGGSFTLGSLRLGQCEQFPLDLFFEEGQELTFIVSGKSSVHIIGNYVEDEPEYEEGDFDSFGEDFDDEEIDSEGEEFDLDEEEGEDLAEFGKKSNRIEILEESRNEPVKRKGEEVALSKKSAKKSKTEEVESEAKTPKGKEAKTPKGKDTPKAEEVKTPKADETKTPKGKEAKTPKQKENGEEAKTPKADETKTPKGKEAKTPKEKEAPKTEESKTPNSKLVLNEPQVRKLPNGLVIEDLVVGGGVPVATGKKVSVKYVGKLTNGHTFDSSLSKPFTFRLGGGNVIKGWDIGLKGMRKGGKRRLTIPSSLAYGSAGSPPVIPPNSTLVFDVELVEFK